jgi:MoaA/NifB/PqqE/SkfB family radical SAM enzyme
VTEKISENQVPFHFSLPEHFVKAIIFWKRNNYSGQNPCYFAPEIPESIVRELMQFALEMGFNINQGQYPEQPEEERATLEINQYNFFRLGSLITDKTEKPCPDFDITKSANPCHDFMQYLCELNLKFSEIKLQFADTRILEILRILETSATLYPNETHHHNEDHRIYFLRLLGIICEKTFVGPHTVHIDVTSRCNARCTFCGYHTPLISDRPWNTEEWANKALDWDIFESMINELSSMHTKEDILLTGGGEPLLHPRLIDMVRLIKEKNMHIILFSNGILLKNDTAEQLVDLGLDKLYWSIHSASPQTWYAQHPGSSMEAFDTVMAQMRHLLKYRKEKKQKNPVIVYVNVLSAVNVHEIMDIVDNAIELGVDELRLQIMHYGNEQTDHMMLQPEHIRFLHEKMPEIHKRLKKAGIALLDNFAFQVENLLDFDKRGKNVKSCDWALNLYNNTGCWVGYFFSRTWVDGRMSFCCHDRVIGDLKTGGYRDNWFSKHYEQARFAAKHFAPELNMDLRDGIRGEWLLADDCSWCGNYEFMNRARKTLIRTGLINYLDTGLDKRFPERQKVSATDSKAVICGTRSYKPREFLKF